MNLVKTFDKLALRFKILICLDIYRELRVDN